MESPLTKIAMKLLFFKDFTRSVKVVYDLVPDGPQVVSALEIAQIECKKMTENTHYALNQIRPCPITPGELKVTKAGIELYTKHFRTE